MATAASFNKAYTPGTYTFNIGVVNELNDHQALEWGIQEGYTLVDGKKVSNWEERAELLLNIYKQLDIILITERNPKVHREFAAKLAPFGYEQTKLSLAQAGPDEPETQQIGQTICYKTSMFVLKSEDIFLAPRYAAWKRGEGIWGFEHIASGAGIGSAVSHLKGYDEKVYPEDSEEDIDKQFQKRFGYDELIEVTRRLMLAIEDIIFFGGDTNDDPKVEGKAPLSRSKRMTNLGFETISSGVTEPSKGREIDHLFHKLGRNERITNLCVEVLPLVHGDKPYSDHVAIGRKVTFTVKEMN